MEDVFHHLSDSLKKLEIASVFQFECDCISIFFLILKLYFSANVMSKECIFVKWQNPILQSINALNLLKLVLNQGKFNKLTLLRLLHSKRFMRDP